MLNRIAEIFTPRTAAEAAEEREERLQIATCVILLEIARTNDEFTPSERDLILRQMQQRYQLSHSDAQELVDTATATRDASVDLWTFTNRINESCNNDEKRAIIEEVWRVIYADGALDGHEDFLVHRVAKLLNLTHKELINAKLSVLDELGRPH